MKIYYINVDRRTDRRALMESQLSRLGLVGNRISAVTPLQVDADLLQQFNNSANGAPSLMPTELAVSLSHRAAWRMMIDENLPYALVLEDDVFLSSNLPSFLKAFDDDPVVRDIIRIETRYYPTCLSSVVGRKGDCDLRRPFTRAWGAAGYIISAEFARRFIKLDNTIFFSVPVDNLIFDPITGISRTISILQTDPGLCIPVHFHDPDTTSTVSQSDIADERVARKAQGRVGPRNVREWVVAELQGIGRDIRKYGGAITYYVLFGARMRVVPFRE